MKKVQQDVLSFLEKWLNRSVRQYVSKMDGKQNGQLFNLIVSGIEKPLIEIVLKETKGNQTQTANILGINRNTLRKKITYYKIKCKEKP